MHGQSLTKYICLGPYIDDISTKVLIVLLPSENVQYYTMSSNIQ